MNTFVERLKLAMQAEGVLAVTLGTKTGIHKANISHLLHGGRKPTLKTMNKLLLALPKTNARWLITGKGKQNGNS
jgi:hypothetical protein